MSPTIVVHAPPRRERRGATWTGPSAGRYIDSMASPPTPIESAVAPVPSRPPDSAALVTGRLHVYVAFDWGDEVDLDRARQLAPGAIVALSRRPRTPTSIGYKPSPLRFRLAPV